MAEAERGLYQDSMRFDDFLQKTHQAASEAIAQADVEAQKHREKCKKIKKVKVVYTWESIYKYFYVNIFWITSSKIQPWAEFLIWEATGGKIF